MTTRRITIEALFLALILAVVGGLGINACVGQQQTAAYPELRDHICQAGEALPDGKAKERLRAACKAEASVRECAAAFEELAAQASPEASSSNAKQ